MNTFDLTQPIKIVNPTSNVDGIYGYYNSLEEACISVPEGLRKGGRTVGIKQEDGSIVEYWWENDNDLSDAGLKLKFFNNSESFEDGFITLSNIALNNNDVTVESGLEWRINGIVYELSSNWTDTIPFTTEGFTRKDIIVATNTGTLLRIEGDEDEDNTVQPLTPIGTLLLTVIDVYGDFLGEPTEPIVDNNYVTKTSQGWVGHHININSTQVAPILGHIHNISFRAYADGHSVIGLNITTANTPDKMWSGATFGIRNDSPFPITLKHLHISSSKIRFNFPSGQDLLLTKEMGVKYFKLGTVSTTSPTPVIAYCLNDFVLGGGDFIPLSGTGVGKPLTGEIEVDVANSPDGIVGFYSGEFGVERRIYMTDNGFNYIQTHDADFTSFFEQHLLGNNLISQDLNTNESSEIVNTPQSTTITTTDADNNKAEIVVGDYGTVRFNSNMPGNDFSGYMDYNTDEGLRIIDNNSNDFANLSFYGIGGYNNNHWHIEKNYLDVGPSVLFLPDSGTAQRRIPVSVNGNYANQQGDIKIEVGASSSDDVSNESDVAGASVTDALNTINTQLISDVYRDDYRTTTAETKDTWVDDRIIHKMTFVGASTGVQQIELTSFGIDSIVSIEGIYIAKDNSREVPCNYQRFLTPETNANIEVTTCYRNSSTDRLYLSWHDAISGTVRPVEFTYNVTIKYVK